MKHRISQYRPFAAMTRLWTVGGLLLASVILLDCGAVLAGDEVSHQFCAMEIQKVCRELNEKLAETTGSFSSNHGNNTVMCGYLLQTLKCVAKQAPVCSDWFLEVNYFYFQSPFDCKMTGEIVQEIQEIKNRNQNTGEDSSSESTGGNDGGASTQSSNDSVTKSEAENSSSSGRDSGKTAGVGNNGGYTVANVHGDKAQHAGNDASTWSTLGMSLLLSAAVMPRLISKYFVL